MTRLRRQCQTYAQVSRTHAILTNRAFFGGGVMPEAYEVYPYWTDEEIKALRLAKYKAIMQRHAAAQKGSEKNG